MIVTANDPSLKSWLEVRPGSDFPIQNLPFGIFQTADTQPRVGVAIGDYVLDLKMLAHEGFLDALLIPESVFAQPYLNELMAFGKEKTSALRNRIADLLNDENEDLRDEEDLLPDLLVPMKEAKMLMPVLVRDYTDFYSSKEHATNVGTMFRDPENALLPNWKHLPVGYHGRASSIIVSGEPIRRPKGQRKDGDKDQPVFGPSGRLDFELEMAFITCKENKLGESISTSEADDYIFGFVLFNDWSARDMQAWEYVPLGPFLAKNFASSVSPWVVTLDALEPFRVSGPKQEPEVLPYLKAEGLNNFDINLEVGIQPKGAAEKVVCRSNFRHMYWNVRQQLAHHTINGCNINVGDMYASGTISGPTPDSYGSMLELAWKGTKPIPMPDGSTRSFLQDGDTVTMRGFAEKDGIRIGFGEVKAEILPAT